jgi:hypothetical protein
MVKVLVTDTSVTLPPAAAPAPKVEVTDVAVSIDSPDGQPRVLVTDVVVATASAAAGVAWWAVDEGSQSYVPIRNWMKVDETDPANPVWVTL